MNSKIRPKYLARFCFFRRVNIHEAIVHIRQKTCVRFVPKSDAHSDYIVIRNSKSACYSSVGRIGNEKYDDI